MADWGLGVRMQNGQSRDGASRLQTAARSSPEPTGQPREWGRPKVFHSVELFSIVWKNGENIFHCVEKSGCFFHSVETFFPLCGKIAKSFSIVWKNGGAGNERRFPAWGAAERRGSSRRPGVAGAGPDSPTARGRGGLRGEQPTPGRGKPAPSARPPYLSILLILSKIQERNSPRVNALGYNILTTES